MAWVSGRSRRRIGCMAQEMTLGPVFAQDAPSFFLASDEFSLPAPRPRHVPSAPCMPTLQHQKGPVGRTCAALLHLAREYLDVERSFAGELPLGWGDHCVCNLFFPVPSLRAPAL